MVKFKFILFLLLLLTNVARAQDITNIFSGLSAYDKQELNDLFHVLMDDDQFIYTLFGDKPVSLSGDYVITPYEFLLSGISSSQIFWKKWAVWKRNQERFCISRYFFIEEPAYNRGDNTMFFIFFINKKSFIEAVNQNIQAFRDVLESDITAVQLLEKMENEHAFMNLLKDNEMLLGILLGYGEHNAKLYARRTTLRKFITGKTSPTLPTERPLPSKGFASIEEEEKFLNEQLRPFAPCDCEPGSIAPVQFAADLNHKETQFLQKKYSNLRDRVSLLYAKNKNFLEIILKQLTLD